MFVSQDIKDVDSEYYDQQVFSVNQYKQSSGHVNRNSNMKQSRHESIENEPQVQHESGAVSDDQENEAAMESSFLMHTARGARSNSTKVDSLSNLFFDENGNPLNIYLSFTLELIINFDF